MPRRPGWILDRQLGIGGFGEVWLAVNGEARDLKLAVKFGRDASADTDLMNERDVIRRLMATSSHRSLVPLKDVSFDGDVPWLAYEYVDGGDLADLIRSWQAMPQPERLAQAASALCELAESIAELHSRAIVHRDLKPSNILIESRTGRLRVTDFGISGIAARSEIRSDAAGTTTHSGRLLSCVRGAHTPLYASPQQKDNQIADFRDDVHAIGVIGYQMFTGHLDRGATAGFAKELARAGVPEALSVLLLRCVEYDPVERPTNATAFRDALAVAERPVASVRIANPAPSPAPPIPPTSNTAGPLAALPTRGEVPPRFEVAEHKLRLVLERVRGVSTRDVAYDRKRFRPKSVPALEPVPEQLDGDSAARICIGVAAGLSPVVIAFGFFVKLLAVIGALSTLVFATWFFVLWAKSPWRTEYNRRASRQRRATRELRRLEAEWSVRVDEYERRDATVRQAAGQLALDCRDLSRQFDARSEVLLERVEADVFQRHMCDHLITDAEIDNIGAGRKKALAEAGIHSDSTLHLWG